MISDLECEEILSHQGRHGGQGISRGTEIAPELVQDEHVCRPPGQVCQEMKRLEAAPLTNCLENGRGYILLKGVDNGAYGHEWQVGLDCRLCH